MRVSRSVSMDTRYWEFVENYSKKNGISISESIEKLIEIAIKEVNKK